MICSALEHFSVSRSFILWGWSRLGSQRKAWRIFQTTSLLLVALVLTSLDPEAVNSSAQHLCCITTSFREKVAPGVSGFFFFQILALWLFTALFSPWYPWIKGFPGGDSGNPSANTGDKRLGFDPWVRKTPWRRRWQPTPVFLPGDSHGQRSLVGYSPWGHKGLNTPEATEQALLNQTESNFQKIFFEQLLVVLSWEFSPSYLVQHGQK